MHFRDYIKTQEKDDKLIQELQNQKISEEQLQEIEDAKSLREKAEAILKTVQDPEIPVNIWDLGLVYRMEINDLNEVEVDMTLTAPACPVAGSMPIEVKKRLEKFLPSIEAVRVKLVWEPKWNKNMMSEEAKFILDMW